MSNPKFDKCKEFFVGNIDQHYAELIFERYHLTKSFNHHYRAFMVRFGHAHLRCFVGVSSVKGPPAVNCFLT